MNAAEMYAKIYMQYDHDLDMKKKAGFILLNSMFHPAVSTSVSVDEIYGSMTPTGFRKEKEGRQHNIKSWISSCQGFKYFYNGNYN